MEPVTKEQLEKLNKKELIKLAAGIEDPQSPNKKLNLPPETTKPVMIQSILDFVAALCDPPPTGPLTEPPKEGESKELEGPPEPEKAKTAAEKYPHTVYPDPETVTQEKLEEIAAKWHTGPDDVRVVLVETERKRQELAAAEGVSPALASWAITASRAYSN